MSVLDALPRIHPLSRQEWRNWLETNHTSHGSVWLVGYKKSTGKPRFEASEAVEEALCFGWIDSLPRRLDDERSMVLMSPRKAGSAWSAVNKARIERLIAAGLMTESGLATIERAKRNGTWTKLDGVDALQVPPALAAAFARHAGAEAHFGAFPKSAKRGILEWIANARTAETLQKRIDETARLAALNIRANQWPRRSLPH